MGQSKGGGYQKMDNLTPQQQQYQNWIISQMPEYMKMAQEGYAQFLPGGGGGKAISDAAHSRFQQQTIPSIMNAFGTGSKTSSGLNQALAAGAANLNTDIAAQLAQMQMQAAQGMSGLAQGSQGAAFNPAFGYQQKGMPFWQQMIAGLVDKGGDVAASWYKRPF